MVSVSLEEFTDVKRSLTQTEAKVQHMAVVNRELKQEVNQLHNKVFF